MSKALVDSGFDYGQLDKPMVVKLSTLQSGIVKKKGSIALALLDLAKLVDTAHKLFAETGLTPKFKSWVEGECGISSTKAYRLLKVYEVFQDNKHVERYDAGAIRKLSEITTPEEIREESEDIASGGDHVTDAWVKEAISEWKAVDDEPPEEEEEAEEDVVESDGVDRAVDFTDWAKALGVVTRLVDDIGIDTDIDRDRIESAHTHIEVLDKCVRIWAQ